MSEPKSSRDYFECLVLELEDFLNANKPLTSSDIFYKIISTLFAHFESLKDKWESLLLVKDLSKEVHQRNPTYFPSYSVLEQVLENITTIFNLSHVVQKELKLTLWNFQEIEFSLKRILQSINLLAQSFQSIDVNQSKNGAKVAIVSVLIPPDLKDNPVLGEFLYKEKEFALLQATNSILFKKKTENFYDLFDTLLNFQGDEHLFYPALDDLSSFIPLLNQEERDRLYQKITDNILQKHVPVSLLQKLLAMYPPDRIQALPSLLFTQWRKNFIEGLQTGKIYQVHSCLWNLARIEFRNLIEKEIQKSDVNEYYQLISFLAPQEFFTVGLCKIIVHNYLSRLKKLKQSTQTQQPEFSSYLLALDGPNDYGEKLRILYLLEILQKDVSHTLLKKQLDLYQPASYEDFNQKAFNFIKDTQIKPWEPLLNGETLIELSVSRAMPFCESYQKKYYLPQIHSKITRISQKNFFTFHKHIHAILAEENPSNLWQQVLQIFELIAFRANDVFIPTDQQLFLGVWDDPILIYTKLLKVYLPESEHDLWKKYCPDTSVNSDSMWMENWRRSAYLGSQQIYGRWFHLIQHASNEAIDQGISWQALLKLIGHYRKVAALFNANIQIPVPHEGWLTARTSTALERIHKSWPGSPLNYGTFVLPSLVTYSNLSLRNKLPYNQKFKNLINNLENAFSNEIKELKEHNPYKQGKQFFYSNKCFVIYPQNEGLTYVIFTPSLIKDKNLNGKYILYNWPHSTTFFPSDGDPICPNVFHKCIWIHASGDAKECMIEELEKLYLQLSKRNETFLTEQLARFLYLFFLVRPFIRGSSATGTILMNLFLHRHGLTPPDAPKGVQSLDCEAMYHSEEEFIRGFVEWLQTDNFFS